MPNPYQDLALDMAAQAPTLRLRIRGTSMAPFLQDGEAVIVQSVPPTSLHLGDLIAVRRNNDTITHRIVAFQSEGILTLGDNCRQLDPLVSPDMILGRVIAVEKKGRQIPFATKGQKFIHRSLAWLGWQSSMSYKPRWFVYLPRTLFWCARFLVRLSLG